MDLADAYDAIAIGKLRLEPGGDVIDVMKRLVALPGIGSWTAQYVAMRALSWPDAFLPTDLGVLKSLETTSPRRAEEIAEGWKPWRSYAVMHLWRRLAAIETNGKAHNKKGRGK